jgi:hypothetical protein
MTGSDALAGGNACPVAIFLIFDVLERFEFLRDHFHSHTLILSGMRVKAVA